MLNHHLHATVHQNAAVTCQLVQTFWTYLASAKISWWYLKRFKSYHIDKPTHTHRQTRLKTIPPSLRCYCMDREHSQSQWPLHTHYCHLRSSASAICSAWHSTGSTRPDCNWTTKFRSQLTSHMELRSPDLSKSTFKQALKTHLFSATRRHWDVFMILAPDINIQTYLLTYLLTFIVASLWKTTVCDTVYVTTYL